MDKMAEKEEVTAETSTEDAEKVVVEPYDAADIDFDTFCKSDMRVVKVKDCVAVKKSKKLLQFTLDDGAEQIVPFFPECIHITNRRNWLARP